MLDKNSLSTHSQRIHPLEQFFESIWGNTPAWHQKNERETLDFSPSCEIEETDKEYLFHFEVPGMKENELEIEVKNQVLTLTGERKRSEEKKGKTFHYTERSYGKFKRSFTLPEDVDLSKIEAKHEHGLLTVAAAKKAVVAPVKIPISAKTQ